MSNFHNSWTKAARELQYPVLSTMSPIAHEFKTGSVSGMPLSKTDNPEGKKLITNGLYREHRLLTEEEVAQGKQTQWYELEVHGRIRNISTDVLKMRHLKALFLANNHLTRIPARIAELSNLTLLDLSNNRLRSLPAEIGDMMNLCHLYLNGNQIRVLPYELGKLFRLQTFALQGNPLSPEIAKIYHDTHGDRRLLQHLLDHLALSTVPPPDRQWIVLRNSDPEKNIAIFSVLCYNVLSDRYATPNLYSYCPQWALNWDNRQQYIMRDISHYDADIITLQEVESQEFTRLFEPRLEQAGYTGIFFPKSRYNQFSEEDRKRVDGCAIFWKFDKFEMEHNELIEFMKVAVAQHENEKNDNMLNRVMPRDNIAIVVVLRIKDNIYQNHGPRVNIPQNENVVGNMLAVCTTHMHWDPEYCDVKLIQSMMLVNELNKILEKVSAQHQIPLAQIPVIISGDFNSTPDSGVMEFLSKGAITKDHPDLKAFREDPCLNRLTANDDPRYFSHNIRLESAVDPANMPYTNYTLDFKGMIDYIFSTPQSLACLGYLGPIDMNWLDQNKVVGFPTPHIPSDHLPILAHFAIIPTCYNRQLPTIQHYGNSHSSAFGAIGALTA